MLHILTSLLAFLVAIAILIPFHEFGHFWVARKLGVKVQRFAVGFGKILFSHRAKDGVEYCLCAIPLGGYVKMLDEREGSVSAAELPFAFNRQKVWKRFLIVLAGPVFNLVLAVVLCAAVFKLGFEGPIPMLGAPTADTPAFTNGLKAKDVLIAIDGKKTPTVTNVRYVWQQHLDQPTVALTVERQGKTETIIFKQPKIVPSESVDYLKMLGIDFMLPPILGNIGKDSPAMKAGLLKGDRVKAINGVKVSDWDSIVTQIAPLANKEVSVEVRRDGIKKTLTVVPSARPDGSGMIGAHLPKGLFQTGPFGWIDSVKEAFAQTVKMTVLNVKMLGQMATGRASFDNISGPVTIARVAGESVEAGIQQYLYFLALISVGLAVLNLLPIPMLDGGHLLFYMFEMVLGRPLSERAQEVGFRVGILLLISLMLIALYNDMMHVVS